jgi:uncharacterized protein (TIGR02594 family)
MLATPAAAQASQKKAPDFSDGAAEFTAISARQRQHDAESRPAKVRQARAHHKKASHTKTRHAKANDAKTSSAKTSPAKAHAKSRHAKVTRHEAYLDRHGVAQTSYAHAPDHGAERSSRRGKVRSADWAAAHATDRPAVQSAHQASPAREHARPRRAERSKPKVASEVTRYEAYLDRHGVAPTSYAYVPDTPGRSANRAVARTPHHAVVRSHNRMAAHVRDEVPAQPPHQWGASNIVAEARRYIGTNPTKYSSLWCAHFMNMVLERTGYRGTRSGLARSFASYGTRVSGPQVGAIAVMSRRGPAAGGGPGGHVGVVSGIDPSGNPIIISGNHNKRVAEAVYPRSRIYAYVMPN